MPRTCLAHPSPVALCQSFGAREKRRYGERPLVREPLDEIRNDLRGLPSSATLSRAHPRPAASMQSLPARKTGNNRGREINSRGLRGGFHGAALENPVRNRQMRTTLVARSSGGIIYRMTLV